MTKNSFSILLFIFSAFLWANEKHILDWRSIESKFDSCITNASRHPTVSPRVKMLLCDFIGRTEEVETFTVTSGCNRKSDHHGPYCAVLDGYFNTYKGSSVKEWALEYLNVMYLWHIYIEGSPFSDVITYGYYPPFFDDGGKLQKNSLHFHISANGRKGRFAFIEGRQVTIPVMLEYFEAVIDSL